MYQKFGIVHQTTVPYSPQQNGLAERMNSTLTEWARGILSHMHVDNIWWAEAMNMTVYVTIEFYVPVNRPRLRSKWSTGKTLIYLRVCFRCEGICTCRQSKELSCTNSVSLYVSRLLWTYRGVSRNQEGDVHEIGKIWWATATLVRTRT